MNPKSPKAKHPKKTPGTRLAEQMRADGNKLTGEQRKQLGAIFTKLYYRGKLSG
jgi:hypothetical protein